MRCNLRGLLWISLGLFVLGARVSDAQSPWPPEEANDWQAHRRWLVGCDFIPSTAINQLEMWQADTFDPATIDRELGWAQEIGFTSLRVFLHNLAWQEDPAGFLKRMNRFLEITHKHNIGVTFVIFDSCWNPAPKAGKQPEPKPFVHNSGWVQSPGIEPLRHPERLAELKPYVEAVIGRFKNDRRVDMWDLFNEPDNGKTGRDLDDALILLQMTFAWAREAGASQPLTSGLWVGNWADTNKLSSMERLQLANSDVISFHSYANLDELRKCVRHLQRYGRPLVCTEYMARPQGSTFDPNLKYLHDEKVGAYNWGFVSGKTQTIYPWDSWTRSYTAEPHPWFHDIFRADGTPYDPAEIAFIKSVTGQRQEK